MIHPMCEGRRDMGIHALQRFRYSWDGGKRMVPDYVLIERWQRDGDADARNQLVERYRGLVRAVAVRYADRGEPLDDLVQVAWIGLLKAVERFDLSRKLQFSTYATPTMIGEIKRHYRDRTWAIHVPRSLQELRVRANAAIDRLTSERGQAPTVSELAEHLDVGEEELLDALQSENARSATPLTFDDADDGERTVDVPVIEAGFEVSDARMMLSTALDHLPARERTILELRFAEGLTQSQIATRVGISQMHVSRLLRRSLEQLRELVGEIDLETLAIR
jgi:RNA polymerase sigma-B factor